MVSTAKVLVVEGTSDYAALKALDRRIGELGATRRRFSLLHEVGQHILANPPANQSGMSGVYLNLLIVTDAENDHSADLQTAFSTWGHRAGATFPLSPIERSRTSALPTWNTRMFCGNEVDQWFDDGSQSVGHDHAAQGRVASPPATARVVLRMPTRSGALLVDSWAAIVRLIDSVLTAELLMRLLVHVGIRAQAGFTNFVLIVLAACRRYGRRSEPAHRTSLFILRNLVSMGGWPLM